MAISQVVFVFIGPYMSHLNTKIKRPVFQKNSTKKRTQCCLMCYLDLCIQLFVSPKDNFKSLSEQNFKKINVKIIKMKPPVALFKKESKKLYLLLKAKSQNLINSCYVISIRRKT